MVGNILLVQQEVSRLKTMNKTIEYIYSLTNASSTLRVIEYLRNKHRAYLNSVVVINLIDRWVVKITLKSYVPYKSAKNLQAFLSEMGAVYQPPAQVVNALNSLDQGETPTVVMNRYQVVIVVHGQPETEEIEIFRDRVVKQLGYCPQNMA